jgi:sec-independent protein translocase protein TatA
MPTSLGPAEILVILVVALIVLGPKRLPEAGRQVGRAIAEVRKWSQGFQDEIRQAVDFDPKPPSYPTPPPGTDPSPIPMVPAETGPPTNGSGTVTTGSHGLVSGPPATADAPDPANDPSEPTAGEAPRDQG